MNVLITKVDLWGFSLTDERTLLFKVLDEVTTHDTMLVQQIRSVTDSVGVTKDANLWKINFRQANFKPLPVPEPSPIQFKSAVLGFVIDYATQLEARYDICFPNLFSLIFSQSVSAGRLPNSPYVTSGFGLGVGRFIEFEDHRLKLLFSIGEHIIMKSYGEKKYINPVVLHAEEQIFIGGEGKYIVSIGLSYSLNRIEVAERNRQFGFRLGLGLH